jgi:hypothetical protein
MKNKTNCLAGILLFLSTTLFALPPGAISKHIKIDQFGIYRRVKK